MNYNLIKTVDRKPKRFSKLLSRLMIVFAVIFVVAGIIFQSGFFFPAILLALLYYFYNARNRTGYEYTLYNEYFTVDVIRGRRRRRTDQVLYYEDIEVVAPPDHETVLKYKKAGGTEKIKKYDYTSYDDDIPYYTMIVRKREKKEKIKLLLDLDEELLHFLKIRYPRKVYLN